MKSFLRSYLAVEIAPAVILTGMAVASFFRFHIEYARFAIIVLAMLYISQGYFLAQIKEPAKQESISNALWNCFLRTNAQTNPFRIIRDLIQAASLVALCAMDGLREGGIKKVILDFAVSILLILLCWIIGGDISKTMKKTDTITLP